MQEIELKSKSTRVVLRASEDGRGLELHVSGSTPFLTIMRRGLPVGVVGTSGLEGNVIGDLTGDVTGNLTGNVTGNVIGDLTGDVTGNADTASRGDAIPVSGEAPVNAVAAAADVGAGQDGTVTVTAETSGAAGNDLTVEVVAGVGVDQPLAASIAGTAITVTLGTDGAGDPDAAKNTATLVAAAVDDLTGVSAVASGTGADPLTAAEGPTSFTGGIDGTVAVQGAVVYYSGYLYIATAANPVSGANWQAVQLGALP